MLKVALVIVAAKMTKGVDMNIAKSYVNTAFDFFGYKLIPNWRIGRYHQSNYLRRLFKEKDVDLVFDVGANMGQYRDYLREDIGFKRMLFSFEPHPECFAVISKRAEHDPNWKVFPFALGAETGVVQFNLMRDSQFSSFHIPIRPEQLSRGSGNIIERTVDVDVCTLDSIYAELKRDYNYFRPFLKMDTQGHDIQVLRGGEFCISEFLAIQAELSNIPIYANMIHLGQSISEIEQLGFDLGAIFPTNPDQFPSAIDFDTYFIKK